MSKIFGVFWKACWLPLIWALIKRRKQQELEQTVKEIEGQKETPQKQKFESSFFQLLGLHNDIVNSMEISLGHTVYQGWQCFDYLLDEFRHNYGGAEERYHAGMAQNPYEARQLRLKWINDKYEELFDRYQSQVGPYFRNLYNVVKFVDRSDFPRDYKTKKFYTNLIRAQLSRDELGLLFYNCLSDRGAKFKKLVEKYALLKYLPFEVLMNKKHRTLYEGSAHSEKVKIYVTSRGGVYVKAEELLANPEVREKIKKMAEISVGMTETPVERKSSGTSSKDRK